MGKTALTIPGKYAVISASALAKLAGQQKNSARVKLQALADLGVITFEAAPEGASEEVTELLKNNNTAQEFYVLNLDDVFVPFAIRAYCEKTLNHATAMKSTNPDGALALTKHAEFAAKKMQTAMKRPGRKIPT